MSNLSIGGASLLQYLPSVSSAQPTSQATAGSASTSPLSALSGTGVTTQAAHVGISKRAKLAKELQQLQQEDPAKYKQVVTVISNQLNQAASQTSGISQRVLSSLASTFQKAEDGSSISLSQPSGSGSGSANSVLAAYAAGAATAPDQQALSSLGGSSSTIQTSTANAISAGQAALGVSAPSTLDSILQFVTGALSGFGF